LRKIGNHLSLNRENLYHPRRVIEGILWPLFIVKVLT
jgi:hypothetical protein